MTKKIFKSSSHSINTWNVHQLQRPNANLPCFLEIALCTGMIIFNSLPVSLTTLRNEKTELEAA